jgi:hypothetical protein
MKKFVLFALLAFTVASGVAAVMTFHPKQALACTSNC